MVLAQILEELTASMEHCLVECRWVIYKHEMSGLHSSNRLVCWWIGLKFDLRHSQERQRRDLRNPDNFTGHWHLLPSEHCPSVIHPVCVAVDESSGYFPLSSTALGNTFHHPALTTCNVIEADVEIIHISHTFMKEAYKYAHKSYMNVKDAITQ